MEKLGKILRAYGSRLIAKDNKEREKTKERGKTGKAVARKI
jgi:hypothetical protein